MKRLSVMVLLLILVAFGLRVWNLTSQSVWWDEAFTVHTAGGDWNNFWQQLQTSDRHPPLYYLSVRGWGSVAGWSEFSLRFLSSMYGVIGLAFLYKLTTRLFGSRAGGFALAAAACSPALIVYSQEGRMYELFFMLTAATLYLGLRTTEFRIQNSEFRIRNTQHATRLLYVALLSEAALLLTHYFAVPLVAAFNLLVLIELIRRKAKARVYLEWLGGQVIAALPILVWVIGVALTPGNLITASEAPPDLFSFTRQVLALWSTGIRSSGSDSVLLISGLIILAGIGAVLANRRMAWRVMAFGLISFVLAFAVTSVVTSFHPRYMLPFSLPLFVLIGGALSNLIAPKPRAISRRVLGVVVLGVVTWSTSVGWNVANDPVNAKDDARGVAAYLKAHASADDVILFENNDYTLSYYDHGPAPIKMISAQTEVDALKQMSGAIGDAKHVWLVHWTISMQDEAGYWRFLLEQAGRLSEWQSFQGYEVFEYELQNALVDPPLEHSGVSLTSVDEGALTLVVDWPFTNSAIRADWKRSSIVLIDQNGHRISSVDADLRDGRNYAVLPIPPGTPPLVYTVSIKFYTAQQTSELYGLFKITVPRSTTNSDPYRTLSGYRWQTPLTPIDNLEAYSLSTQSPSPLGQVEVVLRWRKFSSDTAAAPRLRLMQDDRVLVEVGSTLFERDYPVAQWTPGERVIDRRQLIYPPVRGETRLLIGQGDRWLWFATLTLDGSSLKFDLPGMQHAQSATYGDLAELAGYDLAAGSLAANRPLRLTLYWRALNAEPITTTYTVFTQLIAPDGHLVAQHDAPPDPSTLGWVPGEVIVDQHDLVVVDPTYRGPATLIVGWYNSATVQRVPVQGGGDYVTLQAPIQVKDK